jgi:hypothetical protein
MLFNLSNISDLVVENKNPDLTPNGILLEFSVSPKKAFTK